MNRSFLATLLAGICLVSLAGAQTMPDWASQLPALEPQQLTEMRNIDATGPVGVDPAVLLPFGTRGESPFQSALLKQGSTQRVDTFGPPVTLTCPPGATFESETCGDEDNDGCSTGFCGAGGFEDVLSTPETYCGTVFADGGVRDLDYYRIVLAEVTTLSVDFNSEFPGTVSIVEDPLGDCGGVFVLETVDIVPGAATNLTRTVVGGTYYVLISTTAFDGTPCGTDNDYIVTIDTASADVIGSACAGTAEAEVCGTDTNGGCDAAMMLMAEPAAVGTQTCGTVFSDAVAGLRDIDFYTFTVPATLEVTATVSADFPALFGIANVNCLDQNVFGTANTAGAGDTASVSAVLGAGDYAVFIGTGDEFGPIFGGVVCGDATTDYTVDLSLAAPPAPCALGIPGGSADEGEACGAVPDVNDGCNGALMDMFGVFDVGDTINGSSFASGGTRDTDWFTFEVFADEDFTFSLTSQMNLTALLLGGDCAGLFIVSDTHSDGDCTTGSTTISLAPGNYIMLILPEDNDLNPVFEGNPCGFNNEWFLETSSVLTVPGGCTLPAAPGATPENELCGESINNLCIAAVPGVTPEFSAPNQTWTGTLPADGARDVDYFEFTLAEPSEVTLTLTSQLPASASLIFDAIANCPGFLVAGDLALSAGDCTPASGTSAVLPAGTYYVLLTPGLVTAPIFSGFPCAGGSVDYILDIASTPIDSCFVPTGTVTAQCTTSTIDIDLVAESCYDSVDYAITDDGGNTVDSGNLMGPFAQGDPITVTSAAIATAGVYTVTVTTNCCNGETAEAVVGVGLFPYNGETDIIVANELAAGCTDSVAALQAALEANGRTVIVITFLDGYECGTTWDSNNTIWVMKGTFPNNLPLTDNEALELLNYNQGQGVSIYLEGGDVWGFDLLTAWADFDGVAGTVVDGNVILDGDDTFTEMTGVTTADIDTAQFGPVGYNQDSNNPLLPAPGALGANDFTDQLFASGELGLGEDFPAGSTATTIWINSDDGVPDPLVPEDAYGAAVLMIPSEIDSGRIMSSAFEFGGFAGDQTLLAAEYLAALKTSGPLPGDNFKRGDANDDGGFDISDAIFTLASLFTPGAPQPNCADAGDANDDENFDISDAIFTLAALFTPGAPLPSAPGAVCGVDPAGDSLDCAVYNNCP